MPRYVIHDNGARPFLVEVNDQSVTVYKQFRTQAWGQETVYNMARPIKRFEADKVFIGSSPRIKMTEFSAGFGTRYDGNSILLHLGDLDYVFIGMYIYSFKARAEIIKYVSPIGNSDVPYPYAIDEDNNTYLMIEDTVILSDEEGNLPWKEFSDEPYEYFYYIHIITEDQGRIPPQQPVYANERGIVGFYLGDEQYTMRYVPHPAKDYTRLITDFAPDMYIMTNYSPARIPIDKDDYIKINKKFGRQIGVTSFRKRILVKRI
uniref:Uncharacterized protein n=1 Tax=viral metagenome TaxID=1070528 RepID=A0A6C0JU14_9ZZZZ